MQKKRNTKSILNPIEVLLVIVCVAGMYSVSESIEFFDKLTLTENESKIAAQILKEIKARLNFLKNVGLDYLTLERSAATLSGGEAQRIRLSTQIGSGLTGVMLKNTGLNWNTTVKMVRTEFIGDENNPEWNYLTTDVTDNECVTTHTLSATIGAVEDDYSQTLTLSTTLPPQVDQYNGTLAFVFPYVTLNLAGGIQRTSSTDSTWQKQPFQQSLSLSLFSKTMTITQSFNYNLENDYADSLRLSLAWKNLQVAYTMEGSG